MFLMCVGRIISLSYLLFGTSSEVRLVFKNNVAVLNIVRNPSKRLHFF